MCFGMGGAKDTILIRKTCIVCIVASAFVRSIWTKDPVGGFVTCTTLLIPVRVAFVALELASHVNRAADLHLSDWLKSSSPQATTVAACFHSPS